MFWFVIALILIGIIAAAVLVGMALNRRKTGQSPSRAEQMSALKSSGAFPHRKENQP